MRNIYRQTEITMLFFSVFVVFTSCSKGTRVLSSKIDSVGGERSIAEGVTDQGASGKADSNYRGDQSLQAPATSEIAGAATVFPIGSLSISATIGLNKGSSVATLGVIAGLGLNTGVAAAGTPVSISSNPTQDTRSPFVLSLPIPRTSSLALSDQQLVVFYEQFQADSGTYTVGVLAADDLALDGSVVKVKVKSFGTYQTAYLTKTISGSSSKSGQAADFATPDRDAPVIISIASLSTDGVYTAGQSLTFKLNFSEAVTVTGAPVLKLALTGTTANAVYVSGSGSTALIFTYTVGSADSVALLDYASANPVVLGSAQIADAAGNQANLGLPIPGSAGSLSKIASLQINGTALGIVNVSSTKADGFYAAPNTVTIDVTFSGVVTVTGTPKLKLENGVSGAYAYYSSGSGTNVLSFVNTIATADNSSDLDYYSSTALNLNGGTIRDASAKDVSVTLPAPGSTGSLGANKNLVIDNIDPLAPLVSVGSTTFNSTFTVSINQAATADANFKEFRYLLTAGTLDCTTGTVSASQPTSIAISSTTVLRVISCDLAGHMSPETSATYTLAPPPTTITGVSSTNSNTTYKVGDVISITVNFQDPVTVSGYPQLLLETGLVDQYATLDSVSGSAVTFHYTVQNGDSSADLDYQSTAALILNGATIVDSFGTNADLTLPNPGGSGSLGANKNIVIDGVAPKITQVSAPSGTYGVGSTLTVTVTFDSAVIIGGSGSPSLALSNGRSATYGSVSGTAMTFTYTVAAGDSSSAHLDYSSTSALSLNGRTLTDAAGNAAVLTLPAPSASGSLGYVSAVVIQATTVPPVITPAGTPILPTKPGLTTTPTLKFSIDKGVSSVQAFSNSGCSTMVGSAGASTANTQISLTLSTALLSSGTYSIYAKAFMADSTPSACTLIGSYTTGVYKVVVATNSYSSAGWACAIVNGGLKCWGSNGQGQLGDGTITTYRSTPVVIYSENSGVTDIALNTDNSASGNSTCVVKNSAVYCWGNNSSGQLGDGTITQKLAPTLIGSLNSGVTAIYSSTGTACALKNGGLICWGYNGLANGITGTGNTSASYIVTPAPVMGSLIGATNVTEVSMADSHSCAIASGRVHCWGMNAYGVLGNNDTFGNPLAEPQDIGLSGAGKISTDQYSTCAVVSDSAQCWGSNTYGQLGDGTNVNRFGPTSVFINNVTDIIAGFSTYAMLNTSSFYGWGLNSNSELYYLDVANKNIPTPPTSISGATVSGYGTSKAGGSADVVCFIIDGGVQCRGHNTAANFPGIGSNSGYVVSTNSYVTQVDASSKFSCAIVGSGAAIKCWGVNNQGQLGNGNTTTPTLGSTVSVLLNIP